MRYLALVFFLVSFVGMSQIRQDRPWSLEATGGIHIPFAPSDNVASLGDYIAFGQFQGALRYMFNDKFGVKGLYGMNKFKNPDNSNYGLTFHRFAVEGVVDLGNLMEFSSFRSPWDLLGHFGGGLTWMVESNELEEDDDPYDNIGSIILGFTGVRHLSDRWAILGDVTLVTNFAQQYSYDGIRIEPNSEEGFFGAFVNVSIGVAYFLGY